MIEAPRFGTCTEQRANQCARKCDSDLKILECGIGITAILVSKRHEDKLGNTSVAAIVNAPAIYLLSRENSAATSNLRHTHNRMLLRLIPCGL
jgi:hypothetical protein